MKAKDSIALLALAGMVWIILLVLTTGCTSINPVAPTPAPVPIPSQPMDVPAFVDPASLPVVVVAPNPTPTPIPPHADPVVVTCQALCIPGYRPTADGCGCVKVRK